MNMNFYILFSGNSIPMERLAITNDAEDLRAFTKAIRPNASCYEKERLKSLYINNFVKAIQTESMSRPNYVLSFMSSSNICRRDTTTCFNDPEVKIEPIALKVNLKKKWIRVRTVQRLPQPDNDKLETILDDLQSNGIIRASQSDYTSPSTVMIKNGTYNLKVDFKQLNNLLVSKMVPRPRFEYQLRRLMANKKKYFSLFHVKDVYDNIPIKEDSIKYTSFVSVHGKYEYVKLPPGLKITSAECERYLSQVLDELCKRGVVIVSMEGILIATETAEDHFNVLERFFVCLIRNKLKLDLTQSKVFYKEIQYRSYYLTENGYKPISTGLEPIKHFKVPQNIKDVYHFVNFCDPYSDIIKDYEHISKPLYNMIKNKTQSEFTFGEEEARAFELMKKSITQPPCLATFDNTKYTELVCDASAIGYGAVLKQLQDDNKMHPVYFFAKPASESEKNKDSNEREVLAIKYGVSHFHEALYDMKFVIVTDSKFIADDMKKERTHYKIAPLTEILVEYPCEVQYRPREEIRDADTLSRCFPVPTEDETNE